MAGTAAQGTATSVFLEAATVTATFRQNQITRSDGTLDCPAFRPLAVWCGSPGVLVPLPAP